MVYWELDYDFAHVLPLLHVSNGVLDLSSVEEFDGSDALSSVLAIKLVR